MLGTFSGLNKCGQKEEKPGGPRLDCLWASSVSILICDSRMKELLQEKEGGPQGLRSPMLFLRSLPLPPHEPDAAPCQAAGCGECRAGQISVPTQLISGWLLVSEQPPHSYMAALSLCLLEGTLIGLFELSDKRRGKRDPEKSQTPAGSWLSGGRKRAHEPESLPHRSPTHGSAQSRTGHRADAQERFRSHI